MVSVSLGSQGDQGCLSRAEIPKIGVENLAANVNPGVGSQLGVAINRILLHSRASAEQAAELASPPFLPWEEQCRRAPQESVGFGDLESGRVPEIETWSQAGEH